MGEYLPPPFNLLLLAAVVRKELPDITVKIIDCQAEDLDWFGLEETIKRFRKIPWNMILEWTSDDFLKQLEIDKKKDPDLRHTADLIHDFQEDFLTDPLSDKRQQVFGRY